LAQLKKVKREKGEPGGKPKARGPDFGAGWRALWPLLIPMACAFAAYGNALRGEFLFDDVPTIIENPHIESLGGFWKAAFGPQHSPISNRPVVCLSFSINYALGGRNPFGYHLGNLLIHAANAALLLMVTRRTLTAPNLGDKFSPTAATWTATAIAAVWAVHPLTVDAVTYVTQRTTLLMSFFVLLTLYAVLRSSVEAERTRFWNRIGFLACALALTSKEEAAALPILVLLFDRAYLSDSFAAALTRRGGLYRALALSWLLLLACVFAGPANTTVGFNTKPRVGPFEWLLTESRVLVHYIRLVFWPQPLIGAYSWDFVRSLGPVWRQGVFILGLLATTCFVWRRKPHWAWLGWMFFLLLAPTSSVMPIITEQVAERRMFLPMLAVLIPVVLGGLWLGGQLTRAVLGPAPRRLAWLAVPLAVLVAVEGRATARYAAVFDTSMTFWTHVQAHNDLTRGNYAAGSILLGIAKPWLDRGRFDVAVPLLERAVACEEPGVDVLANMAAAYVDIREYGKAQEVYKRTFAKQANYPNALSNYAKLLLDLYTNDAPENRLGPNDPRMLEAYDKITHAIRFNPRVANYYNNLGSVCFHLNKPVEAERAWMTALMLEPANIGVRLNLSVVMTATGRRPEALRILDEIHRADPRNALALGNLVEILLQDGNRSAALQRVQATLQADPNHEQARALLERLSKPGG